MAGLTCELACGAPEHLPALRVFQAHNTSRRTRVEARVQFHLLVPLPQLFAPLMAATLQILHFSKVFMESLQPYKEILHQK